MAIAQATISKSLLSIGELLIDVWDQVLGSKLPIHHCIRRNCGENCRFSIRHRHHESYASASMPRMHCEPPNFGKNDSHGSDSEHGDAWCAKHEASEPIRATYNKKSPALPGNTYLLFRPNALENNFITALVD